MDDRGENTIEAEDQICAVGHDRPAPACFHEGRIIPPVIDGGVIFFWSAMTAALLLLVQLAVMIDERYFQAFAGF